MARVTRHLISMEVKYCENCGGLWIRRQGDLVVYCRSCRELIEAGNGAHGNTLSPPRYVRVLN